MVLACLSPIVRHQGRGCNSPENGAAYPVFQSDIKRFFAEIDKWADPRIDDDLTPASIVCATDEADVRGLLERMSDPFELSVSFPIEHPAYVGPHASMEGCTRVGDTCGEYILEHTVLYPAHILYPVRIKMRHILYLKLIP